MNNTLLITKLSLHKNDDRKFVFTASYENGKLTALNAETERSESLLGNIYIGKVKNVVPNIQAAFVEIQPDLLCYFSFEDNKNPIFTCRNSTKKIVAGDELLVQVSKENVKTKAPVVTSNLNLPGKYIVLTTGNTRIGISGKLSGECSARLKELLQPYLSEEYGFVVRTNAGTASDTEIKNELNRLTKQLNHIKAIAQHRTCFSILHTSPKEYLSSLRNAYTEKLDKIVTDRIELYTEIKEFLQQNQPDDLAKLSLYEDPMLPLCKLYNLESDIKSALSEKVWLKSGGYLIIQETEAFVVIDVNTGKFNGKKKVQDTFFMINLEAAKEISLQLKIRNLSGIIMIDFIDMKEKDSTEKLLSAFAQYLRNDPVKTTLVDITKLNVVELTRKKSHKPLKEQLTVVCPSCNGKGYLY